MQEYTLSSYEDGYYELTKDDEVICKIFSIYEPPMFVSSAERTHTVMIKTNQGCQFKSSFDPDVTIVPGIKRNIFDNNDTIVGSVAVRKNYEDIILIKNVEIVVKRERKYDFCFYSSNKKLIGFIRKNKDDLGKSTVCISMDFIDDNSKISNEIEAVVSAYPMLKTSF